MAGGVNWLERPNTGRSLAYFVDYQLDSPGEGRRGEEVLAMGKSEVGLGAASSSLPVPPRSLDSGRDGRRIGGRLVSAKKVNSPPPSVGHGFAPTFG